jgi:hypothetical protein
LYKKKTKKHNPSLPWSRSLPATPDPAARSDPRPYSPCHRGHGPQGRGWRGAASAARALTPTPTSWAETLYSELSPGREPSLGRAGYPDSDRSRYPAKDPARDRTPIPATGPASAGNGTLLTFLNFFKFFLF